MTLNDKWYDILKWICIVGIPAVSVLYTGIAKIWGLPYAAEVVQTLDIVAVFLGTLIGISNANYGEE